MLPGPWNLVFGKLLPPPPTPHIFLVGDAKYPIPKELYLMSLEIAWQGFIIWNFFLLCLAWFCVTFFAFYMFCKKEHYLVYFTFFILPS